jgi:hypothetical protein
VLMCTVVQTFIRHVVDTVGLKVLRKFCDFCTFNVCSPCKKFILDRRVKAANFVCLDADVFREQFVTDVFILC